MKLTPSEIRALEILNADGPILISKIPDKNELDCYGFVTPGIKAYNKLDKLGLVIITEEDPIDFDNNQDFCFTSMVFITDDGVNELKGKLS